MGIFLAAKQDGSEGAVLPRAKDNLAHGVGGAEEVWPGDEEDAPRTNDAGHFLDGQFGFIDVLEHLIGSDHIEGVVREGEFIHRPREEAEILVRRRLKGFGVNVHADDAGTATREHPAGPAAAAAEVEQLGMARQVGISADEGDVA
jgi:hypothetical protein